MFFPAQCSLPSPVPHLESDFYWLIFTEEVLSRVVTIRPLRPSFEIFFVGIFSLKKKNQKPSVQRLLRGSETAKGPRQHQGLPHFLPSQLLTLSSVPFFSPSASLPSGPVSSPRSVPATVPVKMPKPSPRPSELLTARAVEQLHDPEAVVQQCFGPHQLQASWCTQEVQHCFHLGADLHALEGRKPLGPQMPPSARAEIPGELAGVRAGWANSSCLERGDQNTRE